MKILFYTTIIFCGVICLISATKNDKKSKKLTQKVLNENYVFVPSGKVNVYKDTLSIQSFIMFKTEVSNGNYNEFLDDLKRNGDIHMYEMAKIDSTLWSDEKSTNNGFQEYYHRHPAYSDHPVVNVSKEGAELYCEWLTKKINAGLQSENKIVFRLPTHAEWMHAARGGLEKNAYPWGSNLTDSKGNVLCNFLRLDATSIGRDSSGKLQVLPWAGHHDIGSFDITAPVKSYWPNGYDIYNMSGNVAEMVADKDIIVGGSWYDPGYDVRIASQKPYVGANRTTGFRVVATVQPSENVWLKVPKGK